MGDYMPNIEVRILPFTAGGHPAVGCNYTVLSFPGAEDTAEAEVIYTENVVNLLFQANADEVAHLLRIYDQVWGMGLDVAASVDLMRHALAKLDR